MIPDMFIGTGIGAVAFSSIAWAMGAAGAFSTTCFFGGVFLVGLGIGLALGLGKEEKRVGR